MPQLVPGLVTAMTRSAPAVRCGGPYAPVKPNPRVSTIRHGVTAWNASAGPETESACFPPVADPSPAGALQYGGAVQFTRGTESSNAEASARVDAKHAAA